MIDKTTQAYQILKVLAVCGEYPFRASGLIPGSHSWVLKVIAQLKGEGYVSISGKEDYKSIRLLQKGFEALTVINEHAREQYQLMTDNFEFPGNVKTKRRRCRQAEIMELMMLAGVSTAIWEKPEIQIINNSGRKKSSEWFLEDEFTTAESPPVESPPVESPPVESPPVESPPVESRSVESRSVEGRSVEQLPVEAYTMEHTINYAHVEECRAPYFYTSVEMKRLDAKKEAVYTRIIGTFISPGGGYAVYNLGDGRKGWSTAYEQNAAKLMGQIITDTEWQDDEGIFNRQRTMIWEDNCIFVARKPEVAIKVMLVTEQYGIIKKTAKKGRKPEKNRTHYLKMDDTYRTTHFILLDETGVRMLKIFSIPDFRKTLIKLCMSKRLIQRSVGSPALPDGLNDQGQLFYIFLDSDIRRLQKFKERLTKYDIPLANCLIACFPWQVKIIREYMGTEFYLQTVDMDEIEKKMRIR